jgi:hypothetical protein
MTSPTPLTSIFREEFTRHKMDDVVTIQHRNVCKDGFTIVDEADAGTWAGLPILWLYNSSLTGAFLKMLQFSSIYQHPGTPSSMQNWLSEYASSFQLYLTYLILTILNRKTALHEYAVLARAWSRSCVL